MTMPRISTDDAIHVIATCTNRKTKPVPQHLRLSRVPGDNTDWRARDWIGRLDKEQINTGISARDLYAGEHWTVARSLSLRSGHQEKVHLWACSAGYGLVSASASLHPYAATFAGGHADSVPGDPMKWWTTLSEWQGPQPGAPRTIEALAQASPHAMFLIMLSPPYLRACRDDIQRARGKVKSSDKFLLISAGTRDPGEFVDILLPADARLQACLGGTRQALNVRVGQRLLTEGIHSRADAAKYLAKLLQEQPPLPRYDRKKLSDEEVVTMIKESLARYPGGSASRLLRELRDGGYACEQRRFGDLHKTVAARLT